VDNADRTFGDRATLVQWGPTGPVKGVGVRIQIKPGLHLVNRGPATVQIGLDGRHGAVLDGLTDGDIRLLHSLVDGIDDTLLTGSPTTDPAAGDSARRARRIVAALAGSGALLHTRSGRAALTRLGSLRTRLVPDAAAWSLAHQAAGDGWELLAARRRRSVLIIGSGRIGMLLAATLASTGVGHVLVDDDAPTTHADLAPGGAVPGDLGLVHAQAAERAVERALGHEATDAWSTERADRAAPSGRPGPVPAADLIVLLDRSAADSTRADQLLAADVPHLSVVVRETSVIVGPLVLPGVSPCLRCLDLHRSENDPQWPLVLAQLLGDRHRRRAPREETALAQSAAALTTLQILGHLDGLAVPASVGATLEVELPDGLIARRPWSAHRACGCHWPPRGSGPGEERREDARPARMLS
jgi:hypothetical protein